jgi:hypothetical protein
MASDSVAASGAPLCSTCFERMVSKREYYYCLKCGMTEKRTYGCIIPDEAEAQESSAADLAQRTKCEWCSQMKVRPSGFHLVCEGCGQAQADLTGR